MSLREDNVTRKSSIKSKLRHISLNRHKAAHFEEEQRESESVPVPSMKPQVDQDLTQPPAMPIARLGERELPERTRGRSQSRASQEDKEQRLDSALSAQQGLSQPQLAKPILSTPAIVSNETATDEPANLNSSFTAVITNHDSDRDDAVLDKFPIGTTGGFLSSMYNAASNLGTVLGGTNQRGTIRTKQSKITGEPSGAMDASVFSAAQIDAATHRTSQAPLDVSDLSLKDMGLTERQVAAGSPTASLKRARASSQPQATSVTTDGDADVIQGTRPFRSGSVATTHSRRRRGSTSLSVFSGSEGTGQKITGFAVASNKRNREFHATFRSVPDADYLLDDYGCALQKEILVHGRMYVSESHICFNSNIFGWVTNLVIAFVDIIAIEKKSTAGIFPNAIQISTSQAKHVFASFISRDTTFDLIVNIWRLTHPLIQTTAHGVEVANTEGDDLYESDTNSSIGSEPEDSENDSGSDSEAEAVSQMPRRASVNLKDSPNISPARPAVSDKATGQTDIPGPSEHAPTEAPSLSDGTAFSKGLLDECFDAPMGKLFELVFGSDTTFMQDFLVNNQKLLDVVVGQFSDRAGKSVRSSSYVKPLSGPIGPKQTRCLLEDTIEVKDFDKYVQIIQSTTSPDVPSGDAFVIKTRFSFMWGPRNTTRLVTNCAIEWSKNSWIKGPIEKASNSGQVQFMADLSEALKNHLIIGAGGGGSNDKKKRSKSKRSKGETVNSTATSSSSQKAERDSSGNSVLGVLSGVAENINMSVLVFIFLFGMLLAMMRMQQSIRVLAENAKKASNGGPLLHAQWQREETDLWAWLSARTMDSSGVSSGGARIRIEEASDMASFQIQEALHQVKAQAAVLERAQELAAQRQHKSRVK